MRTTILYLFFCLLISFGLKAQNNSFEIVLEPIEIPGFGGVQSFAYAQYNDEILLVGGRLDGLHQRQPFAAFDVDGNNAQAIVISPKSKKVWKSSYTKLPSTLKEQLSSTNMQFYQEGDQLILTGGYAYSPTLGDHTTFPYLTVVDVPELIRQVKKNAIDQSSFIQKEDEKFAVCGGQLHQINETYYLVGGHKFEGRYNPIGPDHGPGFIQEYTHEIRKFDLKINENAISVAHHTPIHDEMHLRRRDYNMVPQIQNGKEELMLFSGVFQNKIDVPWLYPVSINENQHTPLENFRQYYNHYHSGKVGVYFEKDKEMHSLFLGGIAQFYEKEGVLVQDNDVPFVKTISDVVRFEDGKMVEHKLTSEMPDYLGAGSELIIHATVPKYPNGVIEGDKITDGATEIGYLLGGIRSSDRNIFFTNTGSQSEASATLFKVHIKKIKLTSETKQNWRKYKLMIYTNPESNFTNIGFRLDDISAVKIEVHDKNGAFVDRTVIPEERLKKGQNILTLDNLKTQYGQFLYTIHFGQETIQRWVHWSE